MHQKLELPGIERIRARFLEMLEQRQRALAEHALAAWEGTSLQDINDNLTEARRILHQIAGTAGSLGFDDLGTIARDNEVAIDTHLDGPSGKIAAARPRLSLGWMISSKARKR